MKFEIRIEQKGEYGREKIVGEVGSYEDAAKLIDLVLAACKDTTVTIKAVASNRNVEEE